MKKTIITGAGGFISGNIAKVLADSGYYIIGISRNPDRSVPYFDEIRRGVLGEPLEGIFETYSVEAIIHCAYDRQDKDHILHEEGTRIWAEQCEKNGVALQIFMSSISADEEALTPYGRKKYELEKWFIAHNHVVLRLGLVIGNGGIFRTIVSMVEKSPVIPLIDRGKTLTYISDIDTVSSIVRDVILNRRTIGRGRIWHLQQETPILFVDILKAIREKYHFSCVFVPVPYVLVSLVLFIADKIRLMQTEITTDNLKAMRQNSQKKFKSDLNIMGYPDVPFGDLMKKLLI